jgi:hypothetical protein
MQLGHPLGWHCPMREPGHKEFAVIDSNGIHLVLVNFCRCAPVPHRMQLLRIGWWLATLLEPQTCATMSVLRQFHLLNLQGKVTGFSFYCALEHQTDNMILFISLLTELSGLSVCFYVNGTGMASY